MKKSKNKRRLSCLVFAIFMLFSCIALTACGEPEPPYDPYAGMVLVSNGAGGEMWIVTDETLPVSDFDESDFYADGEYIDYRGEEYTALRGIDVSEHQQEIDWEAVKSDGVEFAIIRAGYRGYSEGGLSEDLYFRQNINDALAVGLKVGVYFFSQAISVEEAEEEARYLLEIIDGYELEMPVFYDWEPLGQVGADARTFELDVSLLNGFCRAFTDIIEAAGYDAGLYFYRSQGYYEYVLGELSDLVFWSAAVGDHPCFYYAHSIWQYSFTGNVSGIDGGVDLNIWFEEAPVPTE